mgnify:CR=1 FL=1
MNKVEFETEMIRLKDLLKATDLIPSGGLSKLIIKDEGVLVNGEICNIPGKKLSKGDIVIFDDTEISII